MAGIACAAAPLLAQLAAPPSRTWNLRGSGAGTFKTVLDISGRDEMALYYVSRNPKDLGGLCEASKQTDRDAQQGIAARLATLEARHAPLDERVIARQDLAQIHAYAGEMAASASEFEQAWALLAPLDDGAPQVAGARAFLEEAAGVANLRRGEI